MPTFHTGASTALALNLTSEALAFSLGEQAGTLAKTAPGAAPILISLILVQEVHPYLLWRCLEVAAAEMLSGLKGIGMKCNRAAPTAPRRQELCSKAPALKQQLRAGQETCLPEPTQPVPAESGAALCAALWDPSSCSHTSLLRGAPRGTESWKTQARSVLHSSLAPALLPCLLAAAQPCLPT